MPYASTAAREYGLSLESTTELLGLLADNGLRASTIGTSLRKVFTDLSIKGLDFNDVMDKIRNSTDKVATAYSYFGRTGANTGVILADSGVRVNNLTGELENFDNALRDVEGSAKKVADVMADNLSGDLDKAKNAWSAFVLEVLNGDGEISDTLRNLTKSFTDFINSFSSGDALAGIAAFVDGLSDIGYALLNVLSLGLGPDKSRLSDLVPTEAAISELEKLEKKLTDLNASKESSFSATDGINKEIEVIENKIKAIKELAAVKKETEDNEAALKKKNADNEAEAKRLEEIEKAAKLASEQNKKRAEEIKLVQELTDRLYINSLRGQEKLNAEFDIWYKNELSKIKALKQTNEQYRIQLGYLETDAKLRRAALGGDTVNSISGKPGVAKSNIGSISDIMQPMTTNVIRDGAFKKLMEDLSGSINLANQLSSSFNLLGDAISDAIEGQDDVFTKVVVGILKALSMVINALLVELIIGTAAFEASRWGIAGLAAAAVAIPIAIGALNGQINKHQEEIKKNQKKKKFATGGIVGGSSFSGDQVVANVNSGEMILNRGQQAQLFSMANGAGGGSNQVEFEIKGDKLVGVLSNYNRKMSKIR
jgi:hypothetical protein